MTIPGKVAFLTATLLASATLSISHATTPTPPPANVRVSMLTNIPELKTDALPLSKVLDYLRSVSDANLVVNWKALEAASVAKDTPITLDLTNIPLRKALRLVLDQASPEKPLVFSIDSNVISITTQEQADKVMVTRVYVVEDLVMTDYTAVNPPVMDLSQVTKSGTTSGGSSGGGNGSGGLFTESGSSQNNATPDSTEKRGDDLVKLITAVIRPEIWRDNGGNSTIKYFNGKLIITAPLSVQDAIGGPNLPEGGQSLATH